MSASIPAPPPESEPAIVITTGILDIVFTFLCLFSTEIHDLARDMDNILKYIMVIDCPY